ncbi:hypothetical protein Chor_001945 [Crotalus horridus]
MPTETLISRFQAKVCREFGRAPPQAAEAGKNRWLVNFGLVYSNDWPGICILTDEKQDGFLHAHLPTYSSPTMDDNIIVYKACHRFASLSLPATALFVGSFTCTGYDFPAVLQWFAERVDLIILLFDAHKLEISDEFSEAIRALKGNEDKIRVVLNKADMVETQQLMRVYGALMWSLGKVFNTPEVLRVYIGSFWSEPLMISDNRRLFELEEQDLFTDIQNLPRNSALRKLNDLVKRARLVRVHAHIISHLKREMPSVFGKDNKKKQLINKLPEMLMVHDFTKFHGLKPRMVETLDELLTLDIAKLMPLLRQEEVELPEQIVQGGAFDGTRNGPFIEGATEGAYEGMDEDEWVVTKDKPKYDEIFYNLSPMDGKLSGTKAKNWMVTTKLPNSVLGKIWKLSDVDRDGMLDDEEFALASHLIEVKLEGHGLPSDLPRHLVPPSKRRQKGSAE